MSAAHVVRQSDKVVVHHDSPSPSLAGDGPCRWLPTGAFSFNSQAIPTARGRDTAGGCRDQRRNQPYPVDGDESLQGPAFV
ncbi:hypothetical protein G6F40_016937 [Rhizopus arrhizus]|nr:hypothetical protein G6F40_016937 [Rhizopus arrhizus]